MISFSPSQPAYILCSDRFALRKLLFIPAAHRRNLTTEGMYPAYLDVECGVGLADVLLGLEGDLLLVQRVHVEGVRHHLLVDASGALTAQHAPDLPRRVECLGKVQKQEQGQYVSMSCVASSSPRIMLIAHLCPTGTHVQSAGWYFSH